jgi:hypothetical protein
MPFNPFKPAAGTGAQPRKTPTPAPQTAVEPGEDDWAAAWGDQAAEPEPAPAPAVDDKPKQPVKPQPAPAPADDEWADLYDDVPAQPANGGSKQPGPQPAKPQPEPRPAEPAPQPVEDDGWADLYDDVPEQPARPAPRPEPRPARPAEPQPAEDDGWADLYDDVPEQPAEPAPQPAPQPAQPVGPRPAVPAQQPAKDDGWADLYDDVPEQPAEPAPQPAPAPTDDGEPERQASQEDDEAAAFASAVGAPDWLTHAQPSKPLDLDWSDDGEDAPAPQAGPDPWEQETDAPANPKPERHNLFGRKHHKPEPEPESKNPDPWGLDDTDPWELPGDTPAEPEPERHGPSGRKHHEPEPGPESESTDSWGLDDTDPWELPGDAPAGDDPWGRGTDTHPEPEPERHDPSGRKPEPEPKDPDPWGLADATPAEPGPERRSPFSRNRRKPESEPEPEDTDPWNAADDTPAAPGVSDPWDGDDEPMYDPDGGKPPRDPADLKRIGRIALIVALAIALILGTAAGVGMIRRSNAVKARQAAVTAACKTYDGEASRARTLASQAKTLGVTAGAAPASCPQDAVKAKRATSQLKTLDDALEQSLRKAVQAKWKPIADGLNALASTYPDGGESTLAQARTLAARTPASVNDLTGMTAQARTLTENAKNAQAAADKAKADKAAADAAAQAQAQAQAEAEAQARAQGEAQQKAQQQQSTPKKTVAPTPKRTTSTPKRTYRAPAPRQTYRAPQTQPSAAPQTQTPQGNSDVDM